jgi:RHS repeat-associated protein
VERRDYLFVPGERHPIAVRIDGRLHCYHLDRTGSPVALTDPQGEVVWSAQYDAFGEARIGTARVRQPLRHLGQYHDEETGLHYNVFRYYDPAVGRYLTPDPLRYRSGGTQFYSYAGGDPVNRRDPDGHLVFLTALAIVAGAALVGGLIGGAIEAASAEEGKGLEAFAKGFGWGALGGAVGAAVPLIGMAAGMGAVAIGAVALTADAVVAGVEACSETGFELGTFGKAAGMSAVVTVATLGLSKIPGVRRVANAVADKIKPAKPKPKRVLVRYDDRPHSSQGSKPGRKKSHIDDDGTLQPCNPNGDCSVQQHVRGSEPKKSESPFTSTMEGDSSKSYGDQKIVIDRDKLEADIADGKLPDTEVVDHDQVVKELDDHIAKKEEKLSKATTEKSRKKAQEALDAAKMDKANSQRDHEVLVKGPVPSEYFTVE